MINFPKALIRTVALSLVVMASISVRQSVLAASWKSVGDYWYIDSESAKKYGDIANITVRYKDDIGTFSFDCKRRLLISPTAWADGEVIKESASDLTSKMFNVACSKWFEIWKR